jgi:hypothetical protein
MVIANLRTPHDAELRAGERWVLELLKREALAMGVGIVDCRWLVDDDADGEDRCVLTFRAAGLDHWEPFDPADLEDVAISRSIRAQVAAQVARAVQRLVQPAVDTEAVPALPSPPAA